MVTSIIPASCKSIQQFSSICQVLVGQLLVDLNPDASDRDVVDRESAFSSGAPRQTRQIGLGRWQLQPGKPRAAADAGDCRAEEWRKLLRRPSLTIRAFLQKTEGVAPLDLTTELAAFGL